MAGKRIFNWKVILIVCIFLCGITEVTPHVTAAKGKMKLSRVSMTMKNDDLKSIRIQNPQKKVRWKISTKKYAHIDTYGKKNSICEISTDGRGEAGSFTVTATVGKRRFKCRIFVKGAAKDTAATPTETPTPSYMPEATLAPQITASPAPSAGADMTGFDKVKQCVKTDGYINKNNGKTISDESYDSDGTKYVWAVVYEEASDSLELIMSDNAVLTNGTAQVAVDMVLKNDGSENASVKCINLMQPNRGQEYAFTGTTTIQKSTFTSSTVINIVLEDEVYASDAYTEKKVCESAIKLAFSGWNNLLKKYGFSLADLGFTAYGYQS